MAQELTLGEFYQTDDYQTVADSILEMATAINDELEKLRSIYPEKNGERWKINDVGVVYYGV